MTVPGKYLKSTPITLKEIRELSHLEGTKIIGGPIRLGFGEEGGSSATDFAVPGITLAKKETHLCVCSGIREAPKNFSYVVYKI